MPDVVLTNRFDTALLYASQVHGGQKRKATKIPYIAHLLAVTALVLDCRGLHGRRDHPEAGMD